MLAILVLLAIGRVTVCHPSAASAPAHDSLMNHTCFNLARVNLSAAPPADGHFTCPDLPSNPDQTECCGSAGHEFCCSHWDTVGMKWAIGIGITLAMVIFMALGYTIQLFRACDRCYHEFPVLCEPEEYHFSMDTRWYTVSHEGNRYGVTFHSMRFASHFMELLEEAYGPWNAANILRIRRDDQDFVVLHIFFNDFFTPWFYTQGPIKNDEEWIRTDFKDLCRRTQVNLVVHLPTSCCCCRNPCGGLNQHGNNKTGSSADPDNPNKSENIELIIVPPVDDSAFDCDSPDANAAAGAGQDASHQPSCSLLSPNWTSSAVRGHQSASQRQQQQQQQQLKRTEASASDTIRKKDHRPWTKHTFKVRPPPRSASQQQQQKLRPGAGAFTTVIREDIIECYGNDKCIQTRCEIVI